MADYKEFNSLKSFSFFDGTFESIKNNLFMRLFNKCGLPLNKELEDVPYFDCADLVITFSVEEKTYINSNKGINSYLITNEDLQKFNKDKNELRKIATKNIEDKNSVRIETVTDHILRTNVLSPIAKLPKQIQAGAELSIDGKNKRSNHSLFAGNQYGPVKLFDHNPESTDILVISNRTQAFASIQMIMPDVLNKVYDKFGENFYIVPTSIHELICIRTGYATDDYEKSEKQAVEDLEDMVEQTNDILLKDSNDILSYNIYYYMHEEQCSIIANKILI